MKWWKFNTIYVNGSSLTAGGGMNVPMNKTEYKRLLNIDIGDEKNVTYPKYIAEHFNTKLIHEAQSGGGAPRLIRMTYNHIQKVGIENAKKTLFLFEITDPVHRIDFYCEKINDYVIVNVRYDNEWDNEGKISSIQIQETTTEDGIYYDHKFFEGEIENEVKIYLEKYHNPVTYTKKFIGELAGLFSFLDANGIEYFYMFDNNTLQTPFQKYYDKLKYRDLKFDGYSCINQFSGFNGLTVSHDLKGYTDDLHPGYYGHKLYAERIIKILTDKLKPKLFVFGDSHTQSFESHNIAGSQWSIEYSNLLGYTPKNFADVLSSELDIDVMNYGKGGCSNYTIMDTFLEKYNEIQKNDIVVFGWTTESRFRIANEVNDFVDIMPFSPHPKQNNDVDKNTTNQIALNKMTYNVWWKEINNFIKIIKDLLLTENVYFWTWVKNDTKYPDRIWSEEMLEDDRLAIYFSRWGSADEDLKDLIRKNSDVIYDYNTDIDVLKIKEDVSKGLKVVIINADDNNKTKLEESNKIGLRFKHFSHINYKKECFKNFIPYRNYMRILEETNNKVDDLHLSEKGHLQLSKDLLNEIKKH